MTTTRTPPRALNSPHRLPRKENDVVFWVCAAVGSLAMGYGLLRLFAQPIQTVPLATGMRFAAILLLHDLLVLPLVFGAGLVMVRWVPSPWRPPIRFALFVSAMVALIAIWGLAGQAIDVQPGNDQVLPNHYPTSVAILLAPVWLLTLFWGIHAQRGSQRTPDDERSSERHSRHRSHPPD